MVKAIARERNSLRSDEASSSVEVPREQAIVDDFFSILMFFPPRIETAARILRLNQKLSDDYTEREFAELPEDDSELLGHEADERVVGGSWVSTIMERVSAILFHEDEPASEQDNLTEEEAIQFFQKTLSERIYNHLGMLSRSPHAKKGRPFSIREELTEGIAENIGLGLYLKPETPEQLRDEAKAALLDLALEFQQWLLKQGEQGTYNAPWGLVYAVGAKPDETELASPLKVLLDPDVQSRAGEAGRAVGGAGRAKSAASYVPSSLAASASER